MAGYWAIAGYERVGVVARGAHSTIWKGYDPALQREVALKQLSGTDAAAREALPISPRTNIVWVELSMFDAESTAGREARLFNENHLDLTGIGRHSRNGRGSDIKLYSARPAARIATASTATYSDKPFRGISTASLKAITPKWCLAPGPAPRVGEVSGCQPSVPSMRSRR